jgi:putative flavoprotein involved in K+ transport
VTGGVLVVGGAQSGVQIAQDLIEAGRDVHLATSRVARIPRRYRGRDAFEWMRDLGHLDLAREDAGDEVIGTTAPQLSGIGEHRTVSYQALARAGVKLVGRVRGVDGGRVKLDADVGANVRFADDASRAFRALCDTHADATRHVDDAHDPADEPAEHLYEMRGPGSLDLRAAGVSTVVWATGFGASIGWLPERAVDGFGRAQLPGLDVVGAPWLTHRASSNLYGMVTDAERVAASLADVQPAPRLHHSSARLAALRTVRPTLRVAVG